MRTDRALEASQLTTISGHMFTCRGSGVNIIPTTAGIRITIVIAVKNIRPRLVQRTGTAITTVMPSTSLKTLAFHYQIRLFQPIP